MERNECAEILTKLANTKINSIMGKLTKTQLFNQLKDESLRSSFRDMGIINSIKMTKHADTLNDFKGELIYELDRLQHIIDADIEERYHAPNEYANDLYNRYVWYLGVKEYYRSSTLINQIKSIYKMANYVGYNVIPRIGGHDLIAK